MSTKIITIKFRNRISKERIPYFRGAVLKMLSDKNILFHNHLGKDGFRYSYPLVQYKNIDGCAAIVCVGAGADAVMDFLSNFDSNVKIGGRAVELQIDSIKTDNIEIVVTDKLISYALQSWLPFNQDNYGRFCSLDDPEEQLNMLESILTANILSLSKGLGIFFDEHITCCINDVLRSYPVEYKGVKMTAFDIVFTTDVVLPDYAGVGKGVSIGNGVLCRSREEPEIEEPLLINYSNHPYRTWSDSQKKSAEQYGRVVDVPFPQVPPDADEDGIRELAGNAVADIARAAEGHPVTVHIMGEMTLVFAVVSRLKEAGVRCIASTTVRNAVVRENGVKETVFVFERFREYNND